MQLAEIWEPKRGHIWMKRWIDTHRLRKAARLAMERLRVALGSPIRSQLPRYHR